MGSARVACATLRTQADVSRPIPRAATEHRSRLGNLADRLSMSKSGVYAHFGSKQDLQLATVEEAERIFRAEVIEPALAAAPGLGQLLTFCDGYLDHLARRTFPGCFFAAAVLEMGTRPGPVKERVAAFQSGVSAMIRGFVVDAIDNHELPADEDADALTFELNGIILAANSSFVLHDDRAVLEMPRRLVRRRLGVYAPAEGQRSKRPAKRR